MAEHFKLLFIQIIFIVILMIVIVALIRQKKAINFERRIGRYSINPINDVEISFFDVFSDKWNDLIKRARKYFIKSKILVKASRRYNKYISYTKDKDIETIDFIIRKFFISLSFMLLTIFSSVLQTRVLTLVELIINICIGYFIYDIYLFYQERRNIKLIENEMLRAVIIMNNAFKAGKSTLQAVEIASDQLPEPINGEFKKIYQDMAYGLSVDTVFERFAKRVNIEEARYLSSSLTILNKTGGNIVEVFSFIEKTLFDKKKMREELKNMTVSSNMIVKVLMFIPFVFVFIICLFNPNYFDPLFSSAPGILVFFTILITFGLYVFFLQKIMKVRV
ncbi:MAG: type II secretion system F family protein [bacterium]|nr:type II secretion system F family protein [bacterium]